jgi:hypothetical protein
MTWLEVPLLIGLCGVLYKKLVDFDSRMDSILERLVRLETLLIEIPKRKGDRADE